MSPLIIGLLGIVGFLLLMALRIPIAIAMALSGFLGIAIITGWQAAFATVSLDIYASFSSYSLSVAVMFIWMGYLAFYSGMGSRSYDFIYKLIGHLPGGLALATQGASAFFGAISGSNTATSATIGSIAIPEMQKYRYNDSLSTASVAAGGFVGALIPPSILFIVYGIQAQASIGRLFVAGIVPGIVLMFIFMITIGILIKRNPDIAPRGEKFTWEERIAALQGGLWEVLVIFVISMGGLFAGWFTPTEAGAVGAGGVLLLTLATGELNWDGFKNSLSETTRNIAMILFLIAGAIIFGRFMAISRIPFFLADWIGGLQLPAFFIILIILFLHLILGCFIDAMAMILLTIPIFYPVVVGQMGYDPIWFGVMMLMMAGMGIITPPVGINVYVIHSVTGVPLETIFKGIWPFLYGIILLSVVLAAFPGLVTWFPNLILGP